MERGPTRVKFVDHKHNTFPGQGLNADHLIAVASVTLVCMSLDRVVQVQALAGDIAFKEV